MKNIRKIVITLWLLGALVLSLASCGTIISFNKPPKGYTGGDIIFIERYFFAYNEIHWVETYEEAMFAIERLKANGNNVSVQISTYENEYVDAKYVFHIPKKGSKGLEKGQMWYDREDIQSLVSVRYIGFFDKITIEELEYSYYQRYRTFAFKSVKQYDFDTSSEADISYSYPESGITSGIFEISQNEEVKCTFECYHIDPKDLIESGLVEGFTTDFPKTVVVMSTQG